MTKYPPPPPLTSLLSLPSSSDSTMLLLDMISRRYFLSSITVFKVYIYLLSSSNFDSALISCSLFSCQVVLFGVWSFVREKRV